MGRAGVRARCYWGFALLAPLAVLVVAGCRTARPAGEAVSRPPVSRGAALYTANCQSCHGGATGGRMMDIPPPHNANGHTWHHPDCQLTETVLNGSGAMGDMMRRMMGTPEDVPRMPAFRGALTEEEVAAILAYIKTWWREEQRRFQAAATRAQC